MYSFNTVASATPRSFEILSPDYIFFKSKIASVLPFSISPFFVYFFNIEILFFSHLHDSVFVHLHVEYKSYIERNIKTITNKRNLTFVLVIFSETLSSTA